MINRRGPRGKLNPLIFGHFVGLTQPAGVGDGVVGAALLVDTALHGV